MRRIRARSLACLFAGLCPLSFATAGAGFQVQFNDPGSAYSSYYLDLTRTITAAGRAMTQNFAVVGDPLLLINVSFTHVPTANGGSATTHFVGYDGSVPVYEQGAAYRIEGGTGAAGAADINFQVGIDGYLQNELFFDPDPSSRSAVVPNSRTDAFSVFEHEFGHAFGFNGFLNGQTGALTGNYESTYDRLIVASASSGYPTLYFTGSQAEALYGGPVPLTFDNYAHVGNRAPRDGSDLLSDLMDGVVFYRGTKYEVSSLDRAIFQDIGLPVVAAIPEPATAGLLVAGLLTLLAVGGRRRGGGPAAAPRAAGHRPRSRRLSATR